MKKILFCLALILTGLFITACATDETPLLSAQCGVADGVPVAFLVSTVDGNNKFIHCGGIRAVSGASAITLVHPTAWTENEAHVAHFCNGPVNGACQVTYK
jgi:hypothetical protein